MATFSYIALDKSGKKTSGSITAGDRGEAIRSLDRKGLRPTKLQQQAATEQESKPEAVKEKSQKKKAVKEWKKRPLKEEKKGGFFKKTAEATEGGAIKLSKAEVILFTEELSDMVAAGLQLEPALKSMENRQESGNLQKVSSRVRELVRDGTPFSKALQVSSPSFGPLYTNMAAAGEAAGVLDTILHKQAVYLKTIGELQNKIILAMIYPAFLILAGIGVTILFVTQLIPLLSNLLASIPGAKMPAGAQLLINLSDFIGKWWWVFLIIFILAGLLFKAWKDVPENVPKWHRMKLGIPLIGNVVSDRFYVQFLETMSNLVGNGLTLLRSLELTREATQNLFFKEKIEDVIEEVKDGRALSSSLVRAGHFPDLLIDMVSVGEQTGQIDQSLSKAAERYDKELNNSLQRIMALIMPIVLILIAFLIGMMAYLMLTAIFQTVNTLNT